jgi:paraquat-inducible protein B
MRRANPAIIGGFIMGAVVLVIAGVIILGSGKLFTATITCVMYFEGSLQGLHEGAAVNFRGVKIGSVTAIKMQFDPMDLNIRIPVFVQFPKRPQGGMEMLREGVGTPQEALAALIGRGLRAQLQTESLLTGLLFVQLDIVPSTSLEAPPGEPPIDPKTGLLEIPTVPTTLQEVSNTARKALDKLADLPLEQMLRDFEETLSGINRLVNAPEVLAAIQNANVTFTEMQHLVQHADQQVTLIGSTVTTTLGGFNQLVTGLQQLAQSAQQAVQHVDKQLGQVATNANTTLGNVNKLSQSFDQQALALTANLVKTTAAALSTLEQMRQTLTSAQQLITPNAPVGYELMKTLRELSEAARSLRGLTDYLERHPNAVLFGRQGGSAK